MMAWLDLQVEILRDMAEVSLSWGQRETATRREVETYERERLRKRDYMRTTAPARSRRRMQSRVERAAVRPPCPHCGASVERVGTSAKLPTYCTPSCMRRARFARWYAKHGAARRERIKLASPVQGEGQK